MAQCATTAFGGCSAPSVCARRSRPVRGARAGTWCCVSPVSPFPPRVSRAACGGPSSPGVPYPHSLVRHSTQVCAFRELSPVALLVVPACPLRVCALGLSRRPPPPRLGWCGVRMSRGPGTGCWWGRSTWSVPLRVSCPDPLLGLACLRGGRSGPGSPLPGLGLGAVGAGVWL